MKGKYVYLLVLFLILVHYSSEISFMPNYIPKGDYWHLLFPMVLFNSSFLILLVYNIIMMVREKRVDFKNLIAFLFSICFFQFLNSPNSTLRNIGYILIGVILVYHIIFTLKNVKK